MLQLAVFKSVVTAISGSTRFGGGICENVQAIATEAILNGFSHVLNDKNLGKLNVDSEVISSKWRWFVSFDALNSLFLFCIFNVSLMSSQIIYWKFFFRLRFEIAFMSVLVTIFGRLHPRLSGTMLALYAVGHGSIPGGTIPSTWKMSHVFPCLAFSPMGINTQWY